jgi:hypothetical protein
VAEWLGRALQKLVQRFESARDLKVILMDDFFVLKEILIVAEWLAPTRRGLQKLVQRVESARDLVKPWNLN